MTCKSYFNLLFPLLLLAAHADAAKNDAPFMTCGKFLFTHSSGNKEQIRINGVQPKVQKITFLKKEGDWDNVKAHWIVAATKFQGDYKMDYVKQGGPGQLHAEIVRTSRSQIKISGDYDCVQP
ncbi:hypothetical protein [Erwinia sp. 9145]|uniref:hypothetical protein n=1 Tax=Erwinia sp. 9145 TaxID=1500895 RepID=UPI00068AD4F7|nr:hypothetical protein [Erwinia sp. 9145]